MVQIRPNANSQRQRLQKRRQRLDKRQLQLESLERRELLAAEIAHAIFAPGTPSDVIDQWDSHNQLGANSGVNNGLASPILAGSRWSNTALGAGPAQGDTATLTWGIVPDGTQIVDPNTNAVDGTSDVIAFMDGIYGGASVNLVSDKPWFHLFENVYRAWGDATGLEFVYEANDDGAALAANASVGVSGLRADMRVGGMFIDGNSNVLAFNYFPNASGLSGSDGDMVIDTGDSFYANNSDGASGLNTALHNVLAHEVGHGIGISHVIPVNGTKLMEPFVNLSFYGPQEDDIWNANILYGDNFEPNDITADAIDFGTLQNEVRGVSGASIDDGTSDVDLFTFDIFAPTAISVDLTPTGTQYLAGPQGGTGVGVDRLREADLGFRVLAEDGITELLRVDDVAAGIVETVTEFDLDVVGRYYVEVFGSGNTQLYDLDIRIGRTFNFGLNDGALRLLGVNPNAEDIFSRDDLNLLTTSPTELTLRFSSDSDIDPTTLDNGIRVTGAGADELIGTNDDVVVTPGWIGFGETNRVVTLRFAEPLEDSRYQVEVFGVDIPSEGVEALRKTDGTSFLPFETGTNRDAIDFEVELGARVIAVVPQPVVRDASGVLDQQRNIVHVYFDDDDLFAGGGTQSLTDRDFYQLIRTADTASNRDDASITPINVNPVATEMQTIPDPFNPGGTIDVEVKVNRVELTFANDLELLPGTGAFRLKVGAAEPVATSTTPPQINNLGLLADPGSTFAAATPLAFTSATPSIRLSQQIIGTGLPFDYPGGDFEPGHRDIDEVNHFLGAPPDGFGNIQTLAYNFALNRSYGLDSSNQPLFTTINESQQERVREIFEIYGEQLGVNFVETDNFGTTVVVGDLFPNGGDSGPGGTLGIAGAPLAIMDSAENWYDGYGRTNGQFSFFEVALHEIGHSIGLGHSYELPGGTIQGSNPQAGGTSEWRYPGDHDIVHGQFLYRPDNQDVDMFQFVAPADGVINLETFAERSQNGSRLDTHLQLYRDTPNGPELVAANDDISGNDSGITFDVEDGVTYFVGVTASGNENYNPTVEGTGSGGSSEGEYELLLNFTALSSNSILDAAGTPIDGDGDGKPGGTFDFWFRATDVNNTLFVDASNPAAGDGSENNPFREISSATAIATPGQIIRIVGNAGADGNIGLPFDNFAGNNDNFSYEIGRIESLSQDLSDGRNLIIPQGVTVMVDAGAVFKMLGSRIAVGSGPSGVDRSDGAFQVLGVPHLPVFFTSYNDQGAGLESNPLQTPVSAGNWGGIDIRNGIDRVEGRADPEREGIFLNYIAQADIRYGGGAVSIDGQTVAIAPIRLDASRSTLIGNEIMFSADAAISADPPSFEETNFNSLRYQRDEPFVPDYDRVGPVIYGNTLVNNSINGVLVRVDTIPGEGKEQLSVSARFDDTEVVHVLGDNLLIRGNPGGAILRTDPDPLTLTNLSIVPAATGGLSGGDYTYAISYIDFYGVETEPTPATAPITAATGDGVMLSGLPAATDDFFSRRLYRQRNGGAFELVADLDRSSDTFVDTVTTPQSINPITLPFLSFRARPDARLIIDPGVTVKSDDVRIELGVGADLIAEGLEGRPVIFTSRNDDRYGAGGTFDTTNNGDTSGAAADWAGIFANPFARLSLDQTVVSFAGGESSVGGTSVGFNAIGILQAEARIANSLFENHGSGVSGSDPNRVGRGPNEHAVIHVVGEQPLILDNTFVDTVGSQTAVISINVNSLIDRPLDDYGRQTGEVGIVSTRSGNYGPLISGNRIEAGGIGGMRIRSETLNTGVAFDDTDIVHVVTGEIRVPDLHTYGGLRLESSGDESLVVKFNNNAAIVADGRPQDIDDRIGGSLHVVGAPGFPVILTGISDDTVGAGFDPLGQPQLDTDGNGPTSGIPGSWRGIELLEFSNDRNVETIVEREGAIGALGDVNGVTGTAQPIGQLATGEKASDENLRLGFSVYGDISAPGDSDVYSFTATAGTMVWVDVDRTDASLDSFVEIIDGDGNRIAWNDNSTNGAFGQPGNLAIPMDQSAYALTNAISGTQRDTYTINPLDAGFRVELPGAAGETKEYFLRVTGANETVGVYQTQLRLKQTDEFAGSTVRYSEIRFANVGILASGLPAHSPLTGEGGLVSSNPNTPVDLGNIANSDRAAISVSGNITSTNPANFYTFRVERDSLQSGGDATYIATTFDIDFADGLGRPNTTLLLYYRGVDGTDAPKLVMIANDSNVTSDQAGPFQLNDLDDQSRGSAGNKDPFLGTVELAAGDYDVVVTSNARIPTELNQLYSATATNPDIRLEPVSSVIRIAEDRFGDNIIRNATATPPPQDVVFQGEDNAIPFTLGDATLFLVSADNNGTSKLTAHNPQIGDREASIGGGFRRLGAVAMHPDGFLMGTDGLVTTGNGLETDAATQTFYRLDDGTGALVNAGTTGIQTFDTDGAAVFQALTTPPNTNNGDGMVFHALTYHVSGAQNANLRLFGVAGRGNGELTFARAAVAPDGTIGGIEDPAVPAQNYLYRLDPDTGEVQNAANGGDRAGSFRTEGAGTNKIEIARIGLADPANPGPLGTELQFIVTGLAEVNTDLYAVTDQGQLIFVPNGDIGDNSGVRNGDARRVGTLVQDIIDPANGLPISFTGLTAGPRNLPDYADLLFATDTQGRIFVFDTDGNFQDILGLGQSFVPTDTGTTTGLAFSTLDVNLWHRTNNQGTEPGHGSPVTVDGARIQGDGQNSLYFGFDPQGNVVANSQPGDWTGEYTPDRSVGTYDFPGGAQGQVESYGFDLTGYAAEDVPLLYFNYLLDTEDANALIDAGAQARDSFRVYISSEQNRNWTLAATNNDPRGIAGNDFTDGEDEIDIGSSGYVDEDGIYQFVQILQDVNDWRQARVSLSPWAGHNDVRIRFDFNTAGEPEINVLELRAVRPQLMLDENNLSFQITSQGNSVAFEFDYGLVLQLPGGAALEHGSSIEVRDTTFGTSQVFTFKDASIPSAITAFDVVYNQTDTAAEVALAFSTRLNAFFDTTIDPVSPERLAIGNAQAPAALVASSGFQPELVVEEAGNTVGTTVINASIDLTEQQIRDLMRQAVADAFNGAITTPISIIDLRGQSGDADGDVFTVVDLTLISGDDRGITYDDVNFELMVDASLYSFLGDGEVEVVVYQYTLDDGRGGTSTQDATITISGVNDVPVAFNDSSETVANAPVLINVLANDVELDATDVSTVNLGVLAPSNGVVTLVGNNIQYTPNPGFVGTDSFSYFIDDGLATSTEARVNVRVFPNNAPPIVPGNVTANFSEDGLIGTVDLLGGATEPDGSALGANNLTLISGDDSGITFNRSNNELIVDPSVYQSLTATEVETIQFTVQVSDGNGNAVNRLITINIIGANDASTTVDDAETTDEDTPVDIDVLSNDSDIDTNDVLTVVLGATAPTNGVVTVNPDNTINYAPNPDFFGTDSFTYAVNDGTAISTEATVNVTVNAINDAPIVALPTITATFNETDPISFVPLLPGATDVEFDTLRADRLTVTSGDNAGISFDSTIDSLVVNPAAYRTLAVGESETVIHSFVISDGQGGTTTRTVEVTINGENNAPTAQRDLASTVQDTFVDIPVLVNDLDTDASDALIPLLGPTTSPVNGVVSVNGNGTIRYTPNPGFIGSDVFTYRASDGLGGVSLEVEVDVEVFATNLPPTVGTPVFVVFNENQAPQQLLPLQFSNDPEGNTTFVSAVELVSGDNRGAIFNPTLSNILVDPGAYSDLGPGDSEVIVLTALISDGAGNQTPRTITISINGVNDPFAVSNDAISTDVDTPITFSVLANDATPESTDNPSVLIGTPPVSGTVNVNPNESITYIPNPGFVGQDVFSYRVNDGSSLSGFATVFVTVTPVTISATFGEDDPPTSVIDLKARSGDLTFTPLTIADFAHRTGNDIGVTFDTINETLVVDQSLYNDLAGGETETITYDYNIVDANGMVVPRAATVTIVGANDAPVITQDNRGTTVNQEINIDVLANDSDPDLNDQLTVRFGGTEPLNGQVSLNQDGTIRYIPNLGYISPDPGSGIRTPDVFTYFVTDGVVDSPEVTVSVTVFPANLPPTFTTPLDVTVTESGPVTILNLLDQASDPESSAVSVVDLRLASGDDRGVTHNAANNTLVLDPSVYDNLSVAVVEVIVFDFNLSDGNGNLTPRQAIFRVTGEDDQHIANDDNVTVREDTATTIDVLANDLPQEIGETLIVTAGVLGTNTIFPANGVIVVNADNTITYTPNQDFVGTDQFTYFATDGNSNSLEATVNITVTPVNDAPVSVMPIDVVFAEDVGQPSLLPYQVFDETLRVFGFSLDNAGPLATYGGYSPTAGTVNLPGSNTGVYGAPPESGFPNQDPKTVAASRGSNNAFGGVFIDDVIIGFAERGEMVIDATEGSQTFIDNPEFEALILPMGNPRAEVDFGQFQLEIRQSADYGDPGSPFPTVHALTRTFDTNLPHAQQIGLLFADANGLPISGSEMSDGVFITLSDGVNSIELEFEDTSNPAVTTGVTSGRVPVAFTNTMSAADLANSLRDAINSSVVADFLNISASSLDGETAPGVGTSDVVLLHGPAAADIFGSLDFSSDPNRFPLQVLQFGADIPGEEQGDQNRFRDQGQIILQANTIVDSGSFGIVVDAGQRSRLDVASLSSTDLPRPGSPQAFVTPNPDSLVPGVVVMNNVLAGNRSGGVLVSGDNSNLVQAPQPFARIINNTIYGTRTGDVGIRVEQLASPTLLNNAVANLGTGIVNTSGANDLELFGTIYFNNATDTTGTNLGAFPLTATSELFVDADGRNFYPIDTSALIDSAVGAVDDRAALETLRISLGIAASPIIAPDRDITGQRRNDTPGVNDGSGTGPTVFVDRGAIDRSDSRGPIANLADPLDLIAPIAPGFPELDNDILETYVRLEEGTKSQFVIQLDDIDSTGIDDASVLEQTVVITENGRRLIPGVDYTFGYSPTSNTIVLTPSSGVWRPDAAYEITLNNRQRTVVRITDGLGVLDGEQFTIRDDAGNEAVFEYDSGFVLQVAQTLAIDVTGPANNFIDREQFSISAPDGITQVLFEFEKLGGVDPTAVAIDLSTAVTDSDVRDAIFDALENGVIPGTATPVKTVLGISPQTVGASRVQLGSQGGNVVTSTHPNLSISGVDSGITDGDLFLYQSGGIVVQFEFDDGSLPTNLDPATDPANVIQYNPTDTPDEIAEKIGNVVAATGLGLQTARGLESGRVFLGGQVGDTIDIQSGGLSLLGTPGVTGKLSLTIPAGENGATIDGQRVTMTVGGDTETFLLTTDSTVSTTDVIVLLSPADLSDTIAENLSNAIRNRFDGLLLANANLNVIDLGEPNLIQPSDRPVLTIVDTSATTIVRSNNANGKIVLTVPPASGAALDGQTLTITSAGQTESFLLTTDPLATSINTIVLVQPSDNANVIATALAAALDNAFGGVLNPSVNGTAITLGEAAVADPGNGPFNTHVDLSQSVLTSTGVGGGAVPVPFVPTALYTADTLAGQVIASVTNTGLTSTAFAPGGGTVWFDHTEFVNGPEAGLVNAIRDIAGNDLAPNRPNRETQFTILMPRVELDYGDAPINQYATSLASNGARHTLTSTSLPRLGAFVDSEVDAYADSDDQSSTLSVTSTGTSFNVVSSGPGDASIEVISGSIAAGDIVQVVVDSILTRSYELILAGTTAVSGDVEIIYVPGEPAEVLAERLASAITADLRTIAPRVSVLQDNGVPLISLQSVNDEDGVLIGSQTFNGNTLDGVFLDTNGNIFGFVNPAAPQGSDLIVNTTGGGLLDVWIDYDGDGTFTDPGEQVLQNEPLLDGNNVVTIPQPAGVIGVLDANGIGTTWARFRLSNTGNLLSNGLAIGGEVEDHEVLIVSAQLPVPEDDAHSLVEGNVLDQLGTGQGVSTNDDLAGIDPMDLAFVVDRQPSNGVLNFNADGTFSYTPDPDFYGEDFFTYRIEGQQTIGGIDFPVPSQRATVTLSVTPFNEVPFAVDKTFTTTEWTDGTGPVLTITSADLLVGALPQDDANDRLPPWSEEEQRLTVVQIDVFDATGTRQPVVTMIDAVTPQDGTYTAVTHANLGGGVFELAGSVQVTVQGNEIVTVEYQPTSPFGPGGIGEYNEDNNPNGDGSPSLDSFVFTVADDGATTLPNGLPANPQPPAKTTEATAFIQVQPDNDSPVANDDLIMGAVEDSNFVITLSDLTTNDTAGPIGADDENNGINDGAVAVVTGPLPSGLPAFPQLTPQGGMVVFDSTSGNLIYTPAADYYGQDSFQYTIRDQGTTQKFDTATVILEVAPSNDAPSAFPLSVTTLERTPITILANDLLNGAMGDALPEQAFPQNEANQATRISALTVNGVNVAASGTHLTGDGNEVSALFDANGLVSLTYTPLGSFNSDNPTNPNGSRRLDTFEFTVSDDGLSIPAVGGAAIAIGEASSVSTVSVLVTPQNDAPVATADVVSVGGADTTWTDFFAANGQTAPPPTEDTPLIIPQAFLINNDEEGPTAAADETNGPNDGGLSIVQQQITTSLGGSIRFLPSGDLEYTPPADAFGTDSFQYTIADNGIQEDVFGDRVVESRSATASVMIELAPVNDQPIFDTPNSVTMPEDTPLRTVVLSGIVAGGGESQVLEVTAVSNDTSLLQNPVVTYVSDNTSGTLSLTPVPDRFGVTTVSVTVTDGGLDNILATTNDNLSVTHTFIVRVDPVNDPPQATTITDLTIDEGTGPHVIDVTDINAGGGESQELRLIAVSDDLGLIGIPTATYTSPNTTGTVTFSPEPFQFGTTTLRVIVEDAGADGIIATTNDNIQSERVITVTVNPVNDPPLISPMVDRTINEDSAPVDVQLTGIFAGPSETQNMRVTAVSDNPTLISDPTITYSSPDTTGTLTFVPNADQFGTAVITVTVEDGGDDDDLSTTGDNLTTTESFVVTVSPVNDLPTIDPLGQLAIDEDSPQQTVDLSGITAGGGETQPVRVTASSSNPLLIANPSVTYTSPDNVGQLFFTPVANAFGTATVTVTLEDGGLDGNLSTTFDNATSTASFDVVINPVNDAPTVDQVAPQNAAEDSSQQSITLTGITAGDAETDPLQVTAVSDNPSLIGNVNVTYTSPNDTAEVTYTPVADQFGSTTITVTVTDGGLDGDLSTTGDNGSFDRVIDVTIDPVNDVPTLNDPADLQIDEDSGGQTVALSGISAGINETQNVRVTATSDSLGLIPDPTVTYTSPDATGSLVFTPVADAFGSATITVTVEDGGDDDDLTTVADNLSFSQTFTVTLINAPDSPVANNDTLDTDEDTLTEIRGAALLANDTDSDIGPNSNEVLSIVMPAQSTSALGATILFDQASGDLTYDPTTSAALQQLAPGETLQDSFTYGVTDSDGEVNPPTATVFLNVTGLNDAPVVRDDAVDAPENFEPVVIQPLANDVDVDGTLDLDTLIITEEPLFGSVAKQINSEGVLELAYSPFSSFPGGDSFRYTISDNLGQQSPQALVQIVASSDPRSGPDVAGGVGASGININVLSNDFPVEGSLDLSTLTIVTPPSDGQAVPEADGTITYTSNPGFVGNDSFQYTISDTLGNVSKPTTVSVRSVESGLENPFMFGDVNANGDVSALDALLVINRLSLSGGAASIPVDDADRGPNFFDVNGSMTITALDALLVINSIGDNAPLISAEAEFVASMATSYATASDPVDSIDDVFESITPTESKLVDAAMDGFINDDVIEILAADSEASDEDSEGSIGDLADLAIRDLL